VLHKYAKSFKCLELQRDFNAIAQQAILRSVELKRAEAIYGTSRHILLLKKS